MKHSLGLVSFGLCVLAFGCGSSGVSGGAGSAGGADSSGGSSAAGAVSATGGSASAAAGQSSVGASAGDAAQPSGGASQGGADGSTAGAATGGVAGEAAGAGGASQPVGGGAGQAGRGGAAGLDPAQPPGVNFELSGFTLQLPLADGDSVQQIKDLSVYTSAYFYTAPDGAMTFWCPVTGATTPNSHYPRSELRENAIGGDWAISGTHSLTASFKVTKTPPSKGTIIGQVHGNAVDGTGEILKLEWTSANEIIASVEDNNNASQVDKGLGTYPLNALLSYTIKLENSQLSVSVSDAKGATKTITSSYSSSRWTKDSYYFKLGDYVQLNTGPSTDGGRVSFYSFAIAHGT
ncbi:MAG TPA: polysaccharide lyase family 7 protein [Polyangiaceae bacterium]